MLLWLLLGAAHADISVQDDQGRTVRLGKPAQRIISLAPHLTEDLFAIGAGPNIVGVSSYSDYPAAAKKIPEIGSYNHFDLEQIRTLKPDLIVAWPGGNPARQLTQLESLGIAIYYDDPKKLTDIPHVLERLGVLTGRTNIAEQAAAQLRTRTATLAKYHAGKRPVRVFYQVWDRPLMTINGEQAISDVMRLCGAVNVFAELPSRAPTVDEEAVLVANPDLIATSGDSTAKNTWLQRWARFPRLKAVARNQLYMLPPDLLSRMGPRLVDGAEALCAAVDKARQ
ncbi:cobalamin-binding protein [Chitinimonas sp. BJB300]|nr:cobalamin-binding protein [Chitinimonas sp. BJB300]TSJ91674.1 cobalamin-binding protein [Chitinimonas sp. BJB300]